METMRLIFLCTGNSCRSQMAEGFARACAPASLIVESAGTSPSSVHPLAARVMLEAGIDIGSQCSKGLDAVQLDAADLVVTLCGDAAEQCPVLPRKTRRHHWPIPDPARIAGTEGELLAAFRQIRDIIAARVNLLVFSLGEGSATVQRITPLHDGVFMKFQQEDVLLPNGVVCNLKIIRHPGAACVVPLLPNGDVVLIRQYRHAAGGYILEAPAGKLDHGETPESCTLREIQEEAGLRAGKLHRLGPIFTTPGFTDEVIHLFAATQLERVPATPEYDEIIETITMPLSTALDLARSGEICDGKTLCALWRVEQELRAGTLRP